LSLWIWLPREETPSEAAPPDEDQKCEGQASTQADSEVLMPAQMSDGASESEPNEPADEAVQVSARMYVLYGVVVHSGTSANSGHYYTYGRQLSHDVLQSSHSSTTPVAKLAASLWNHGCAIALMANTDRDGGPGRAHAAEAAQELREGLDAVGFSVTQSSADHRSAEDSSYSILVRLAAELQLLENFATEDHTSSTSGRVVSAVLQSAVNLLAQYAEATQSSSPPKWWLYNDATVSHVTRGFDALDGLGATNVHETPYLLLYKRCDSVDGDAEGDHLGVDQTPPTVRYAVYNDELALLKSGPKVTKRDVVVDRKWAPPPPGGGAGGGAARLPHRFGPAGGSAMGAMDTPKWGM
jgi:hypothetical protein